MAYETLDGYAYIDPEDEGQLRELFLTPEIQEYLKNLGPEARTEAEGEYLRWARGWLKEMEGHPKNLSEGGVTRGKLHLRIPGTDRYFFSIKQALLSLAVSVAPATAVALLVPPVLILKLVPAGVSAGMAIWNAAAALNDGDLNVYTAVVRAIDRNTLRALASRGATLDDIEESFANDPKLVHPKNLTDKLSNLCERNVLRKDTSSTVNQYFKKV